MASAATVHLFTGINIVAYGAMASRVLHVRVDTELVDPMARPFVHGNPVAWTKANRERVLGALYTILLGNPMLDREADVPVTIRFANWYRLVGSAVEHATRCYKEVHTSDDKATAIEFEKLFAKQKSSETEGVSLAEMLDVFEETMELYFKKPRIVKTARLGKGKYLAKEIAACLNQENPPEGVNIIRGFLFQKVQLNTKLSPLGVSRAFGAYREKRLSLGAEILVLHIVRDPRTNKDVYWVERTPVDARSTDADASATAAADVDAGDGNRQVEKAGSEEGMAEKGVTEKEEADSAAKLAEFLSPSIKPASHE